MPSQSPDLHLIESLWDDLKRAIYIRHPKNITEKKRFYKEEWSQILEKVAAAKGGSTTY